MMFQFNGLSFDTSNPVFVLGYKILKSWFAFDMKQGDIERLRYYGVKCKKRYVRVMRFSGKAEQNNELEAIAFCVAERLYRENEIIIGHSPKECLKILKEKYSQMGGEEK